MGYCMNYQKVYNELVVSRVLLKRVKNNDGLLENHHIIPKCLGGTNKKDNLVLLTPREHYIAHWLLYKMHKGKDKARMAYGFFIMCSRNPNQKRAISSRGFERARNAMLVSCSGDNHLSKGRHIWSDEEKKKIGDRMRGSNNHWYGKKPWNTGLTKETSSVIAENVIKYKKTITDNPRKYAPRTDEFKQRVSGWMTGVPKTEECKRKLSEINKGKKLSQETINKIAETRKNNNKPLAISICPHCNFEGKGSAMFKWHFDNCKLSPNYDSEKYTVSEETRQKMSINSKNRTPPTFKGGKHTEEAKKKISIASKNRTYPKCTENRKKLLSLRYKGLSYEAKYGEEKALEIKIKQKASRKSRKGCTAPAWTEERRQKAKETIKNRVPQELVNKLISMYTSVVKPVIKYIAKDLGLTVWVTNRILKEQGLL
jgi:hypothetical protein